MKLSISYIPLLLSIRTSIEFVVKERYYLFNLILQRLNGFYRPKIGLFHFELYRWVFTRKAFSLSGNFKLIGKVLAGACALYQGLSLFISLFLFEKQKSSIVDCNSFISR